MIKITIYIDDSIKEFNMQLVHDIYEFLDTYDFSMEVSKISNKIIFERSNSDEQ